MSLEHPVHCALGCFELRNRALGKGGREPRGQHERVLLAQRNVQAIGQPADDLPARLRTPRLETGEMTGRAIRRQCKVDLGHTTVLAPAAQKRPERRLRRGHGLRVYRPSVYMLHDPRGQVRAPGEFPPKLTSGEGGIWFASMRYPKRASVERTGSPERATPRSPSLAGASLRSRRPR